MLTLLSFALFTGLVGLITWLLTRHDNHESSSGYFLAGRSLTGGFIAGSLLLTNLSTEQLVGLNGAAYADGICVMAWEVIAAVSLVILGLVYLPRYLKSGIATVPQFLENRFDPGTRTITSLIFLVAYAGILLPIILYTGARGMTEILDMKGLTGIDNDFTLIAITVWVIGIIGSIYAIWGGLRSVAVSDTLNGFGLLVGGVLIAYFGLKHVNPEGALDGLQTLRTEIPEKFNSIGGPEQSVPFSTLFTGVLLLNLFYWTTNQQIIQRTFAASSLAEGQKGVLIAGIFKVLAPLILVIPGIIAFYTYGRFTADGETVAIVDRIAPADKVGLRVSNKEESTTFYGDEALAMLGVTGEQLPPQFDAASVSTVQDNTGQQWNVDDVMRPGTVVLPGSGSDEVIRNVQDSEIERLIPPREKDKSYGRLVQMVLPDWLTGFFAAVVTGAILSSFNSALNSTATLFSLGVYQTLLHKNATEQQVIHAGKIFGIVIAILAMTVAPLLLGQDSIFGYLQKMNAIYFIPIFSVMLVGLISRTVPAFAAKIGLVVSFLVICLGYFSPPVNAVVSQIHDFHFIGAVFACTVALMLGLGKLRPRETPWEQEYSGDVDLTPWTLAKPVGIGLVLFVLCIYIYFADFSVLKS